ncbi:MAG: YfcE family phosphodiesterase [Candidatus Odinarchaeia archaeon]
MALNMYPVGYFYVPINSRVYSPHTHNESGLTSVKQKEKNFSPSKNKKILVIGDSHIPNRVKYLHPIIDSYLKKQSYRMVLCTGDLVSRRVLDYLSKLGEVKVVRGNMDVLNLPPQIILTLSNKKIGLVHGSEIYPRGDTKQLLALAEKMRVDILITGHTHSSSIKKIGGKLLLNPGSVTGCWGGGNYSGIPEFIEIEEITENRITINLKKLLDEQLKEEVIKIEL